VRSIVAGVLGFSIGFVLGWTLSFATFVQIAQADLLPRCERDCGMAVAFFIGPTVGLLCGIALAVFAVRKFRRAAD
jgi:hypothetical protein